MDGDKDGFKSSRRPNSSMMLMAGLMGLAMGGMMGGGIDRGYAGGGGGPREPEMNRTRAGGKMQPHGVKKPRNRKGKKR